MDISYNYVESLIDSRCMSIECYSNHNVCVDDVLKQLKRGKAEAKGLALIILLMLALNYMFT